MIFRLVLIPGGLENQVEGRGSAQSVPLNRHVTLEIVRDRETAKPHTLHIRCAEQTSIGSKQLDRLFNTLLTTLLSCPSIFTRGRHSSRCVEYLATRNPIAFLSSASHTVAGFELGMIGENGGS